MLTGARARSNKKDKGEGASRTKKIQAKEEKQEPKRQTQGTPVRERGGGGREKEGWIRTKCEYKARGNSLSNTQIFFLLPTSPLPTLVHSLIQCYYHTIPDPDPIPSNPQPKFNRRINPPTRSPTQPSRHPLPRCSLPLHHHSSPSP